MNTLEAEARTKKFVSLKKILAAVDLSDHSEETATYAAELAKCFCASLTIVHVYQPVPLYEYASETTCTVLDDQRDDLQELLAELATKIQKTGLWCESVFLVGEPAEQISALARNINADLIVTASHHPTLLARLFNLDKASQIVHRAFCPVLVITRKPSSTHTAHIV